MKALVVERSVPRFALARVAASVTGPASGIGIGPLRMIEQDPPELPGSTWVRVRPLLAGICGSDLATLDAKSSRYFESIVSFPFVPGHEIFGEVQTGELAGRRVVIEPVLGCEARGIVPLCAACATGRKGSCERIAYGDLQPGLQTGYCTDTGGGWSEELVVHSSQIHLVPDSLTDTDAVMVEPAACGIHGALAGRIDVGERVVVLGAGTLGLVTLAALRTYSEPASILCVAKHPVQSDWAERLGADTVIKPDELARAVRRTTNSLALTKHKGALERLTGGADVVFDCVGTPDSLEEALGVVRPQGRIVLIGMPGMTRIDLAPLWQREISLVGAYAYGSEERPEGPYSTFELALELVEQARLGELVSARYPLDRYEEAIRHAAQAGRRGAIKVVFDLASQRARRPWRDVTSDQQDEPEISDTEELQ